MGFTTLSVALLTRFLGLEQAGLYFFFVSLSLVFGNVTCGALQSLNIRFGSIYRNEERFEARAALTIFSLRWLLLATVVICVVIVSARSIFSAHGFWSRDDLVWLLAVSACLTGASIFAMGFARASGLIVAAQTVEYIVRPIGISAGIAALGWIGGWGGQNARLAALTYIGIQVLSIAWLIFSSNKKTNQFKRSAAMVDASERKLWWSTMPSLTLTVILGLVHNQADVVILGSFVNPADVAIYKIAAQCAALITTGVALVNFIYGPQIAIFYNQNKIEALRYVIKTSARISFFLGLLIAGVFVLFGQWALETFFGKNFSASFIPFIILGVGRLLDAYFGPSTNIATMTGHQKYAVFGMATAAGFNLTVGIWLSYQYGIYGTAFATAISCVIWNILLAWGIHRGTGLRCGPF